MALRWLCPGILLTYSLITANLQEPFPQGFSMGNQGTVLWENGSQGCHPGFLLHIAIAAENSVWLLGQSLL